MKECVVIKLLKEDVQFLNMEIYMVHVLTSI